MIKKIFSIMAAGMIGCYLFQTPVYASDNAGEEYITISVEASDDSGNLKYAIDTDDPSAFSDSNEFVIPAGTSHTIYVKDAAGNITSQVYGDMAGENETSIPEEQEDGQKINIDLEIGGGHARNVIEDDMDGSSPEPGSATVASKIKTDGSDSAEKVFYTFTTKEGEVLYLVIDQGQGTDNVYLLDTVSIDDLRVLADGQEKSGGVDKQEDNLLSALSKTDTDMDEFEPQDEEEEIEFDYDDAEKEKYLEQLVNEDENFYDADPEAYAASQEAEEEYASIMGVDGEFSEEYEPEETGEEYE